jgi:hypothetical protein
LRRRLAGNKKRLLLHGDEMKIPGTGIFVEWGLNLQIKGVKFSQEVSKWLKN